MIFYEWFPYFCWESPKSLAWFSREHKTPETMVFTTCFLPWRSWFPVSIFPTKPNYKSFRCQISHSFRCQISQQEPIKNAKNLPIKFIKSPQGGDPPAGATLEIRAEPTPGEWQRRCASVVFEAQKRGMIPLETGWNAVLLIGDD